MKTKFHLLIIVALTILSSCISQKNVRILHSKTSFDGEKYEEKIGSSYRVQNGDHLYIKVYSIDPKTSKLFNTEYPNLMNKTYLYLNSYMIDENGFIHFSFLDQLYIKDMTIQEVQEKIQEKLNEYFKETNVVVKLINFQITILGEVNSPGTYTIEQDQINLLQALGLAGGIKDYGDREKIKLIRNTKEGTFVNYINLSDKSVLLSELYYLMPNDVIYIEPRSTKSFTLDKFPYTFLISILAVSTTISAIFLK